MNLFLGWCRFYFDACLQLEENLCGWNNIVGRGFKWKDSYFLPCWTRYIESKQGNEKNMNPFAGVISSKKKCWQNHEFSLCGVIAAKMQTWTTHT